VGTFIPEIEIWNLDSEDCAPLAALGSVEESENAKKSVVNKFHKKKPVRAFSENTHTDAIMSLSLNPFQNEYLASSSADCTVRIWDIDELACKMAYQDLHNDKVQVVKWNRQNEQVLLSGGYDGRINVIDVRQAEGAIQYKLDKQVHQDIECANWHHKSEHHFCLGTESGYFIGYDIRQTKGPVFEFQGHAKGLTSLDFSSHVPSMISTVGADGKCKVWDLNTVAAGNQ
jgi:periodic tryptophan protein 1